MKKFFPNKVSNMNAVSNWRSRLEKGMCFFKVMLQHAKDWKSFCKKKEHFSERFSILCQTVVHLHCWHGASSTHASCHLANTSCYLANLYKRIPKPEKNGKKKNKPMTPENIHLPCGHYDCLFLFLFFLLTCGFTGYRDLPNDRSYLADKRHLCVSMPIFPKRKEHIYLQFTKKTPLISTPSVNIDSIYIHFFLFYI